MMLRLDRDKIYNQKAGSIVVVVLDVYADVYAFLCVMIKTGKKNGNCGK